MSLVLRVKSMLEDIQRDEDWTGEAERAWARLGLHLGFASARPEKQYRHQLGQPVGAGASRHAVTELKTSCMTSTIAKKDLDQLGGSIRWDQEHSPGVTPVPAMVHPRRNPDGESLYRP